MSDWIGDVVWGAFLCAWLYGTIYMLTQMVCRKMKSSMHKQAILKPDSCLNFVSIKIRFK